MKRLAIASFLIATPALAHTSGTGHIHPLEAGALLLLLVSAAAAPRILKAIRAKK
ncbi:MAG: hypothetical protein AAFR98_01255 [Pseudomonadota bacterium]